MQKPSRQAHEHMIKFIQNSVHTSSSEVLYGIAGTLSGCLQVNAALSCTVFSVDAITMLADEIIRRGHAYVKEHPGSAPAGCLMYAWHDKEYLGAAHGIVGILTVLLQAHQHVGIDLTAVRSTIDYVIATFVQPDGNIASKTQRPTETELVQWCHGAPGLVMLLTLAYSVFHDESYTAVAERAGECVWRQGLLHKGLGLCHGVAGNAYGFLSLHTMFAESGNADRAEFWLSRARGFAQWMHADAARLETLVKQPDDPFSLYEGIAGTICFLADLMSPDHAAFPLYEIARSAQTTTAPSPRSSSKTTI